MSERYMSERVVTGEWSEECCWQGVSGVKGKRCEV